jgi:hypothetical protein
MTLLAIAAGVSLASGLLGANSSRKARKSQKRADQLAAKRAAIMNIKSRRAAAASIRRSQAQQVVAAMANGARGSSGDMGTASSLASQGLSSIADQLQQQELGAGINEQIARSNKYQGQAANWGAVSSLALGVANLPRSAPPPQASVPSLPVSPLE